MMRSVTRALALLGVAIVLSFYAEMLLHAPVTGQDFRNFYAAATVLRHGGNPYDSRSFLSQEERLYHPVTTAEVAALRDNPYVQGPPLAIAFMPFVGLPPGTVYRAYAALLAVAVIAALAIITRLRPASRTLPRAVLLLLSPVTFLGLLLGQMDAVLLLSLTLALWLLDRERPSLAGAVLALGVVKPQIMAGPIVLLALMFWHRGRIVPYMAGLGVSLFILISGSMLIAGPDVVLAWARELIGFSGDTMYAQVDISSLSTLYVGWAPHAMTLTLIALGVVAWAVLAARLWQFGRLPQRIDCAAGQERKRPNAARHDHENSWLCLFLTGWLLVTPYAHPHDDLLLLPVAWYLLGRGPYRGATYPIAIALVITWWLLPMTSILGLRPPLLRGLGIVPLLLLLSLSVLHSRAKQPVAGTTAIVA